MSDKLTTHQKISALLGQVASYREEEDVPTALASELGKLCAHVKPIKAGWIAVKLIATALDNPPIRETLCLAVCQLLDSLEEGPWEYTPNLLEVLAYIDSVINRGDSDA